MQDDSKLRGRFNAKWVEDPVTGCHLWMASRWHDGYGKIKVNGVYRGAHRVAWILANGPIPDNALVLHRCDVHHCVRHDHLFVGTHADNMADRNAKGRQARGERVGGARLSGSAVAAIRDAHASGAITQAALAAKYGCSPSHVSSIVRGRVWAQAT